MALVPGVSSSDEKSSPYCGPSGASLTAAAVNDAPDGPQYGELFSSEELTPGTSATNDLTTPRGVTASYRAFTGTQFSDVHNITFDLEEGNQVSTSTQLGTADTY